MKPSTYIAMAAAIVLQTIPAVAQQGAEKPDATAASAAAQKYTCTMHPEVVQDKPGKCPKCGMKLVPKEDSGKSK
jgi:hypothetical protein